VDELSSDFDLVIVTARHPDYEKNTKAWINSHFENKFHDVIQIGHPDVVEKPQTKAEVCKAIGAIGLVDDSLGHVQKCAAQGLDGILFGDYPWNQSDELPEGVTRCVNWSAVLEHFNGRG
jgi:hypothetical protein